MRVSGMSRSLNPAAARYVEETQRLAEKISISPLANVAYGGHEDQQLEIYAPEVTAGLPALIFFPGGAWMHGQFSFVRFMAPVVTALPAIFVAALYRRAPEFRWPAHYEDARDAITLGISRVAEMGGDTTRIVLGGHSSGGHLATMAVLKQEIPSVRACFPVSASFDLRYGDVPEDSLAARVYKYLLKYPEQDAEASPINYVEGNKTPFHITWGEKDYEHVIPTVRPMITALENRGTRVTWHLVRGASHFDTHLALAHGDDPWYGRLREALINPQAGRRFR